MISDFTKLLQASMRPIAVVMILFIIGWLLTTGREVPMWLAGIAISVISFLFGERVASK